MYGIFGEDRSDFETLKAIVRKLKADDSLRIRGEGFGGGGNLINGCWLPLKLLHKKGFRRFIGKASPNPLCKRMGVVGP
jgi:hypothetical protein